MQRTKLTFFVPFFSALAIQTLHEVEHLSQFYQRWWLRMGPQEAHGILFFLDVEWNHFLFNLVYFTLLAVVMFILLFVRDFELLRKRRFTFLLFVLGFLVQAYHLVEHTVRMEQFFKLGCTPCPGILGWHLDLVYLHFSLNTATWLLPTALLRPTHGLTQARL